MFVLVFEYGYVGLVNCQGGTEAKAPLVSNGRALSIFCREGPWGDDLHLFSGLMQGLTFSAKRLLKILNCLYITSTMFLFAVFSRKFLELSSSDGLSFWVSAQGRQFF